MFRRSWLNYVLDSFRRERRCAAYRHSFFFVGSRSSHAPCSKKEARQRKKVKD